jgi:hypothetical protein
MTGNKFQPDIVARELIMAGETDLRGAIHREYPELTALGIERVIGIAHDEMESGIGRGGRHDGNWVPELENRDPAQRALVRRNWENVPECQADERPSGGRPIDRRAPTK